MNKKSISLLLVAFVLTYFMQVDVFAAKSSTDTGYLGSDQWAVQSDGDIIPLADSSYDIGASGAEVDNIYADSIWVGGAEYTSFAAGTDGNWTDTGLTLTLDQAPTKFIATYSSGNFYATQFTSDDFYGSTNAQNIDLSTNNAFKFIDNSDTLTITATGNDFSIDSTDGGVIFALTDATDGTLDIQTNNDTDDYIQFTTSGNVPSIVTAGTCNLTIAPDGGTTTVTGALTATGLATAAGLTTSSTITLQNSETIINSTNGTVSVTGTANPILNVLDAGTSDSDATISLSADAAADNGDVWRLVSDGATNSFLFENNTSGSQATIASLSTAGLLTLTGGLTLSDSEAISNASDVVTVTADDAGATLKMLGYEANKANLLLYADQDDDATDGWNIEATTAGTLTIGNDSAVAGTDVVKLTIASTGIVTLTAGLTMSDSEVLTNASDAVILTGDDNDTAFRVLGFEAKEARLQLNADQDDDATDGWEIASSTAGTLTFGNDSSAAGTYLDKLTLSSAGVITLVDSETITNASDVVTFQADDAAGSVVFSGFEASASSITIQSDEGDDAADKVVMSMSAADVFTLATGAVTAVTIAATGDQTIVGDVAVTGTTPLVTIGDGGDEDTGVQLNSDTTDYYIASENTLDDLLIGVGSAIGTTPAIGVDANADVHLYQDIVIDKTINFAADAEANDTYVITLQVAPAGYTTGMQITFTANTANTGACTVNVNGLGAKALKSLHDQDPADNYIEAGSVVVAVYDGTNFQMIQPDANP